MCAHQLDVWYVQFDCAKQFDCMSGEKVDCAGQWCSLRKLIYMHWHSSEKTCLQVA